MSSLQPALIELKHRLEQQILGQHALVEALMISLLADGHLLVEGAPGLAKTRAIKALSEGIDAKFHRLQFTPDLLPADLTGSDVFRPQDGRFEFQAGPIFHNLLLADEINRAPAKVQSALLEAMAERQVSVGHHSYSLPKLFLVMATQNPIEQEGTYPLPEAQLDRFLLKVSVDYPNRDTERAILHLTRQEQSQGLIEPPKSLSPDQIFAARQQLNSLHLSDSLEDYLLDLVMATRKPEAYGSDLSGLLENGSSPRGTLALERCARARAWLAGRDYVSPDDIQSLYLPVMRHRIRLSYSAEARGMTTDSLLQDLLERVALG